jgi:hypothetical protein
MKPTRAAYIICCGLKQMKGNKKRSWLWIWNVTMNDRQHSYILIIFVIQVGELLMNRKSNYQGLNFRFLKLLSFPPKCLLDGWTLFFGTWCGINRFITNTIRPMHKTLRYQFHLTMHQTGGNMKNLELRLTPIRIMYIHVPFISYHWSHHPPLWFFMKLQRGAVQSLMRNMRWRPAIFISVVSRPSVGFFNIIQLTHIE